MKACAMARWLGRPGIGAIAGLVFLLAGGSVCRAADSARCAVPAALREIEQIARESEFTFLPRDPEAQEFSDVRQAYLSRRHGIVFASRKYKTRAESECLKKFLSKIDESYVRGARDGGALNPYIGKDMVEMDLIFHLHGNYMNIFPKNSSELFPHISESSSGSYLNSNAWEDGFQRSSSVRDLVLSSYALCYSDLADKAHDRRVADTLDRSLREIRSRKARSFADALLVRSLFSDSVFKKCEAGVKRGR